MLASDVDSTHWCKKDGAANPPSLGDRTRAEGDDPAGERALVCTRCHYPITNAEARIEMLGRHEHRRSNPHGYHFRIGCFAWASGCVASGQPSSHFSWFPGYAWQVEICGQCQTHLGWHFHRPDSDFYGLVLDNLRESETPS